MGKYMKNCVKDICEAAVMEVGVRTRARAVAMAAVNSSTAKRRKFGGGELKFPSSLVELRSRRRLVVSPATSENSIQHLLSSPSSDDVPASCCSSNRSSDAANERTKFIDSEEECVQNEASTHRFDGRERRETTPSSENQAESGELDSTARPSEAISRLQSTMEKKPSEAEIEEFFAVAEKDLQKRFSEKYNYDIVKDVPCKGRYEWVRSKP